MTLAYDRLENAHRSGRWAELGIHRRFTYSWFSRVQRKLLHLGTDRLRRILSDIARVGVELRHNYKGSRPQIPRKYVYQAVINECWDDNRHDFLRTIRHCNLVFYEVAGVITSPLPRSLRPSNDP